MSQGKVIECDVLIVGGGPAGLSVAAALPDGVHAIVVHQDREIGKPVRTSGGSWVRDLERLGVPERYFQRIDQLDIYSDNCQAAFELHEHKMAVLDVTGLYQWLARKSERKKRDLLLATKFLSTRQEEDGRYRSDVRSKTADVTSIRSSFVIDASGGHCAVLRALSLIDKPWRNGVGVEYEFPLTGNAPNRAILFVGSSVLSGYGWAFPTPDNTLRIGAGVLHPDTDASPRTLLEQFLASPQVADIGLKLSAEYEVNAGVLPSIPYDSRLVFGNVIRVGDSANFATPTVGEGIRIAIEFGEMLGQALGDVVRSGSRAGLRQYERHCRRELAWNYRFGLMVNRRIATYRPLDWDRSVQRLSRLNEAQVCSVLRSEFTPSMVASAVWKTLKHKLIRTGGRVRKGASSKANLKPDRN